MKTTDLSPTQQKFLAQLGSDYTTKRIDTEECIYRNFGDFDVEVSGGRSPRRRISIFVWQTKPYKQIVEQYLRIPHDCSRINAMLEDISQRYINKKTPPLNT